jgi:hypothetical protein
MEFVPPKVIIAQTAITDGTMRRLRQSGQWEEGIHYCQLGYSSFRYNLPLIQDWIANRHQPEIHEIAVRNYLASLPSSQPPKKPSTRKPKT